MGNREIDLSFEWLSTERLEASWIGTNPNRDVWLVQREEDEFPKQKVIITTTPAGRVLIDGQDIELDTWVWGLVEELFERVTPDLESSVTILPEN